MRWKTTLVLLLATVGLGTYISLYEIRQPSPTEREQQSKQILNVAPERVTQLVLDLPKAKVTLVRQGTRWTLAPKGLRADGELVNRILEMLTPLTAERILSGSREHPLDPKTYGLEPAAGWLSLVTTTPTTLLFGDTTAVQHHRYAKVATRPEVFVIASQLFETANIPTETFRDPLLLPFESWQAQRLSVTSLMATFTLTRRDNAWTMTQPLEDRVERTEVNALLTKLAAIRIKQFVDDTPSVERMSEWGFDRARAEVTLQQSEPAQTMTLFVGKAVGTDASLVYAKRSDEPSLYAVSAAEVDALLKRPEALRATTCFDFSPSTVTKVALTRAGITDTIEHVKDQWQETRTQTTLDAQRVQTLLERLAELHLTRFVDPASPGGIPTNDLGPPEGTITVWTTSRAQPQRLSVGRAVDGSTERYGRIDGRPALVQLPEAITDLLATPIDRLRPPVPSPTPSAAPAAPHSSAK